MNSGAGRAADGTREKGFPTNLVFPNSLRKGDGGQDFLMMKNLLLKIDQPIRIKDL